MCKCKVDERLRWELGISFFGLTTSSGALRNECDARHLFAHSEIYFREIRFEVFHPKGSGCRCYIYEICIYKFIPTCIYFWLKVKVLWLLCKIVDGGMNMDRIWLKMPHLRAIVECLNVNWGHAHNGHLFELMEKQQNSSYPTSVRSTE